MSCLRRSWVEINLKQICKNYQVYKENIKKDVDIMAVVKANAYGHGDVQVASCLQEVGVKQWAVSNILEAIRLREAGILGEILVLGYTPLTEIASVLEYDITQAIISEQYAQELLSTNLKVKCQIAIDSGMNRIGLNAENVDLCEHLIRKCYEKLNLNGIFTHLCVADNNDLDSIKYTKEQIERFNVIAERIQDLQLKYIHYANSATGLWHRNDKNLVRLGIILYGLKPNYENNLPQGIKPALEWKSVISMIKTVYPNETIGYGRTFCTKKQMKIATIPTGYADGYNRLLSNKGFVLIKGKRAPIVGRICMDQFMIDVSDIMDINEGDEVVLLGGSKEEVLTADDMALLIDTIGYEIVCNISNRVPRVYV